MDQPPFRARQVPDFRRYWLGGLLSNVGTSLQNIAAAVVILELTGSPLWVGYLSAATYGPLFVLGLWGGAVSDRLRRKRVVDLTCTMSILVSGALVVIALLDGLTPGVLLTAAVLLGCSYSVAKPNWSALLPHIVGKEHLAPATAISVLQYNGGNIIGALLSSVILLRWGPAAAFAVNAATFFAPMVAIRRISAAVDAVGSEQKAGRPTLRADLLDGLRYLRRERGMLAILGLLVALDIGAESFRTLAVPLAGVIGGQDERLAGILLSGSSIPMAAMLLVYGRILSQLGPDRVRRGGFALQGAGLIAVGLSGSFVLSIILAAMIGAGAALVLPGLSAELQRRAEPAYLGRVSSAFAVTHLGLRPVGGLLGGAIAAQVGPQAALIIIGCVPLVAMVAAMRIGVSPPPKGGDR